MRCLLLWKSPQTGQNATPENQPPGPAAAPNADPSMPTSNCRGCILPCSTPWHAQGWPPTHWQGSVRFGCRELPPLLEISTNRQKKPQPPTTNYYLPSPAIAPTQASSLRLHTAELAFDLAVPLGMPRAGHSHTGRALCAVVAKKRYLHNLKTPALRKTAPPIHHLPSPAAAPSAGSTTPAAKYKQKPHLTLK